MNIIKLTPNSLKLSAVALALLSAHAVAKVEPQPYITDSGVALIPTLTTGLRYDDNLTLSKEDTESSGIFFLQPAIYALAERGDDKYSFNYVLSWAEYFSTSVDDYVDHNLGLNADWGMGTKHRFAIDYQFADIHEGRGSGITEGLGDVVPELVRYRTNDVAAKYTYGTTESFGRLELNLGWGDQSYTRLKEVTKYRDWEELRYGATFYYNLSSATQILLELSQNDREYRYLATGGTSLDNSDTFALIGVRWDITGKTTGEAKIGYEDKRFDSEDREDFDGLSWNVNINYLPVEYSRLMFATSSQANDPDQLGDYVQENIYQIEWEHYWLERFSSKLNYSYTDESYTGIDRDDETQTAGISFGYDFRRWLSFSLGYDFSEKDSNLNTIGYRQNMYNFTVSGSM